ncbi:hypothetical protein ACFZBU_39660 [Embleya sp. NPDC008237]|uniref:hypothetical protein n=1 Tax=Embleya sp. NPDC008237 TaxID=3363978 RepID=UPI0036E62F50
MTNAKTTTRARLHAVMATIITIRNHVAIAVGGTGGALIGYAAVEALHAPRLLRIALAGLAGIYFAIVLDDILTKASTTLCRRRSCGTSRVSPDELAATAEADLTAATARMTKVAESAAASEAAYSARIYLDSGAEWFCDKNLWQGHHKEGASLHIAPGVRLIWQGLGTDKDGFTLATGDSETEVPVTSAAQLLAFLEARRSRTPDPVSSQEVLV